MKPPKAALTMLKLIKLKVGIAADVKDVSWIFCNIRVKSTRPL